MYRKPGGRKDQGRVWHIAKAGTITNFAFDYFLKDHLGNVRMVLTDERQVDRYPTATLEANAVKQEQQFYGIDTNYVVKAPSTAPLYLNDNGFNNPNTYGTPTANSQKMYQLNGSTNKTGLSTILKVMTGDSINIYAKSYYHYSGTASNSALSASELITSFLGSGGSSGNPASIHGATVAGLNANTAGTFNPLNLFSNSNPVNPTNNVKAGINYIIFDEQFNYVSGSFDPVNTGTKDSVKTHILQNIVMPKNGYIYIYCSNESNINVFFDNLEVKQTRGPILEETHYYPFGLAIAGISSKAAGKLLNKYGITCKERQSQEFSDGSGLEEYDFGARFYDHQIGRFSSIDPHIANYYWLSPYSYCNNNPIKYLDPSGMDPETSTSEKPKDLSNVTIVAHKKANNSLANRGFGWANNASTSGAKHTMNQQQAYQQARGNGFSQTELTNSWRKQGINDRELDRFERGYKSEVDYRNMSLIAIGSIGAPILAIGGIETGLASYLIIGSDLSWKARFSIGVFDAGYQYINTGKINPVQTALSSIGPLSYALAANTTFDIHQSQPLGINPDATFGSIFISTGFNMLGGAGVDVFDQNGAGAASGAISLIPGIWNDGFNDLTK